MAIDPRHRIVVGVDGSETSLHAVRWAAAQALLRMARVEVVHVGTGSEAVDALLARAGEAVGDGLDVTTQVVDGDVAECLVARAEGADMLVVARGGVVCAAIVALARCPVVVVPPSRRS